MKVQQVGPSPLLKPLLKFKSNAFEFSSLLQKKNYSISGTVASYEYSCVHFEPITINKLIIKEKCILTEIKDSIRGKREA